MIVGKKSYFTKKHILKNKGESPSALAELALYCLELVAQLAVRNFNFTFKGGNSLLILMDKPQRFSIDVDISTKSGKKKIISVVKDIVEKCELFKKFEIRQHKTKPWLPLISFNLYLDSFFTKSKETFIMLDAVLEPTPYETIKKEVKCYSLYNSSVKVKVPSYEGLSGDKLLTIGPETYGIPIGKNKETQRIKHIFDISLLSEKKLDMSIVRKSMIKSIEQETKLQKSVYTMDQIKQDTINFLILPLLYPVKPRLGDIKYKTSYLYECVKGFNSFRKFPFSGSYTWKKFSNDSAKVLNLLNRI